MSVDTSASAPLSLTPSSAPSPSSQTPKSVTSVTTPATKKRPKKHRSRLTQPRARPSAIPAHLVTPRSSVSTAPSSTPRTATTPVASEPDLSFENFDDDELDPLSMSFPMSPSADTPIHADGSVTPADREGSVDTPLGRPIVKWKRIKRPFKELGNKILIELRRKDVYGFFLDPVNIDDYPDYLEKVGGEDKMMDLGTMQNKLEENEYLDLGAMEADFHVLVTAALAFNLPGTAPYREANKLKAHGIKHFARSHPLVLTPTASPSPSQRQSLLPDSEAGTPAPTSRAAPNSLQDVPPRSYIPEEMLKFPPNSLQALAVGWNLTGGRRVHAKRVIRGREKFTGKWRDWEADGSRDLAEMDEPDQVLDAWRLRRGDEWHRVVDWKVLRENGPWWEWEGTGGSTGQPPLPGAPRIKREPLPTRELGPFDWGLYPEIEAELGVLSNKSQLLPLSQETSPDDELQALADHLRPDPPRQPPVPAGWPTQSFANIYESQPAGDWVRTICLGDVHGEAYNASVQRFVRGALEGAAARKLKEGCSEEKMDPCEVPNEADHPLQVYVSNKWRNGVLKSEVSELVDQTALALRASLSRQNDDRSEAAMEALSDGDKPLRDDLQPDAVVAAANRAYARIALRDLTSSTRPLDLMPLLREPSDFMYLGVGGKNGVMTALTWVGLEIERIERIKAAVRSGPGNSTKERIAITRSKRRITDADVDQPEAKRTKLLPLRDSSSFDEPSAATPNDDTIVEGQSVDTLEQDKEDGLRKLRLELVALSKFYPLASLKKMDKVDANRLLPANVRGLMSKPT